MNTQPITLDHEDNVLNTNYAAMPAIDTKIVSYGELDSLHIHLNRKYGMTLPKDELIEIVTISKAIHFREILKTRDIEGLITNLVLDVHGFSFMKMQSISRRRELVEQRQLWMWLMKGVREKTVMTNDYGKQITLYPNKWSLKSIGQKMGGRDHSTVIHSCTKISDSIDTEPDFKQLVKGILIDLGGKLKHNYKDEKCPNYCVIELDNLKK